MGHSSGSRTQTEEMSQGKAGAEVADGAREAAQLSSGGLSACPSSASSLRAPYESLLTMPDFASKDL